MYGNSCWRTWQSNGKQTQSDQHDGISQINCYFYLSFSELKTRKKKTSVSSSTKRKKEKINYFTTMTVLSNHCFVFLKRTEKKMNVMVILIHSRTQQHIYIHQCTQCVLWYVPLLFDRATWSRPSHPLPTHYTDIHRPLKQDVQKLVFSIKQCRALT